VTFQEWEVELHRLLGLPALAEQVRDTDYREPGRPPLSGAWRGYYLQPVAAFAPVEMNASVDGMHSVQYAGVLRAGILRGVWSLPASGVRGLFVLGPAGSVPAKEEGILRHVPLAIALIAMPFRIGTILRHRHLAQAFVEMHPNLAAWLA
jgi:hypothetical protein